MEICSVDHRIANELKKYRWWGRDPIRSRAAVELGKHLDPDKFENVRAYVDALVEYVEKEAKMYEDRQ